jgi:hypothetical protein
MKQKERNGKNISNNDNTQKKIEELKLKLNKQKSILQKLLKYFQDKNNKNMYL